jgi:hypothetical protein
MEIAHEMKRNNVASLAIFVNNFRRSGRSRRKKMLAFPRPPL